jgi:hypothetical protein
MDPDDGFPPPMPFSFGDGMGGASLLTDDDAGPYAAADVPGWDSSAYDQMVLSVASALTDEGPPAATFLMPCPECNEPFSAYALLLHIQQQHPILFMVWANLMAPSSWPTAAEQQIQDDAEEDEYEYEALLALCERIGDHTIGVTDVDAVSECLPAGLPDDCRICLEGMRGAARRLHRCGHAFCAPCIETWLAKRKRCPLCNQDAEAAT